MQACRVLRNSSALAPRTDAGITSFSLPNTIRTGTRPRSPLVDSDHARSLANVAVSESQALHQPEQSSTRKRASILLQNTVSLLPRALSNAETAVGPESSIFWRNILERSITELSSGSDQVPLKATIAGKPFCDCVVRPFIPDPALLLSFLFLCSLWFRQVGLFT